MEYHGDVGVVGKALMAVVKAPSTTTGNTQVPKPDHTPQMLLHGPLLKHWQAFPYTIPNSFSKSPFIIYSSSFSQVLWDASENLMGSSCPVLHISRKYYV